MMGLDWLETGMVRAFDTALAPVGVVVAALAGAAHALRPGHGKTLAAAYLLAGECRRRHAVALAGIVAAMHTASVLLLGAAWWVTAGGTPVPVGTVTRWGQLSVAGIVTVVGVVILRGRWRELRRSADSAAATVGTGDGHAHRHRRDARHGADRDAGHPADDGGGGRHDHRATHSHGPPPGVPPWSRAGLTGIASVGALVPSPTAFLVLISGMLTGRAATAVAMVVAFGLGLAATVLAVGMAVMAGRDWLAGRAHRHRGLARLGRYTPLLSAAAVLAGGVVLSVTALAAVLAS